MIDTTTLTDPLNGMDLELSVTLPKRIDILNEIDERKKSVGFYTNKLLPGILLEVGKSLVEKWEKLDIPIMKFGNIIKALTRLAMDKTPKDLEDVFDVAKCRHYHGKTIEEIGMYKSWV